jgi:hypothetical protein
MFVLNPTRVWDMFTEPNNITKPSEAVVQNQASIHHLMDLAQKAG